MLRLAELQKKIDETAKEIRHIMQDDQGRRSQHRELRQESPEREMCPWAISKYFGDWVPTQVLLC
jgi:hypothetical protein